MESKESFDIDFSRYLLTLKRRWVPALNIFVFTVTLAALSTIFLKPTYEAEGKLLFKIDRTSFLSGIGEEPGDLTPLVAAQNPLNTEIEVIYSPPLLQKTIKTLHLKSPDGQPLKMEAMKKALSVKVIGGTDVLRLAYTSKDPKVSVAVVNKLMSLYIENEILNRQLQATSAREFIFRQLPQTEATVREADTALLKFQQKNYVVNLSEEAKSVVEKIGDLDSQIVTVQAEINEAYAQTTALRNKIGLNSQSALAVTALSQSSAVQGVLSEIQQVEKQIATERSKFLDGHPAIVSLEDRKATLQALLQEQIGQVLSNRTQVPNRMLQIGDLKQNLIKDFLQSEVKRISLARRLDSLYNSRSAYERRAIILPQLQQNQRELERKLEAAQSTYQTLLKKLQDLQVTENQSTSNVQILAKALIPEKPVLRKKLIILALGVMLGAFLSTSTVLFLEMRDRFFKSKGYKNGWK